MPLPDDVEELHLIAEYHSACRALRRMGWGGIVWGIINIVLGTLYVFNLHPINAVLALIGLLLLAAGIWCLVLPGAEGVIANGIALLLVGVWNIVVTLLNLAAGAPPHIWAALLGIFFIAAAVQSLRKYARFSRALRHGASTDELAEMDKLVKRIMKANPKTDGDMVLFTARGFPRPKGWRGLLRRNMAIFVETISRETMVTAKEEFSIEPHGKQLLSQMLKAKVTVRDHKWEALILPAAFDNYRDWKFSDEEFEDYRADEVSAGDRGPETGIRPKDDRDTEPPTSIQRQPPRPDEDDL